MKNFIQDGDRLDLTPAAAVSAGQGYLFGAALFGVAMNDVAANAQGVFIVEGVVDMAKTAGLAIAVGDRVFWDATNKVVNKTTTAQQQVGIAVEASASGASTVKVLLQSALPVAT